jgi:hypothetical protein
MRLWSGARLAIDCTVRSLEPVVHCRMAALPRVLASKQRLLTTCCFTGLRRRLHEYVDIYPIHPRIDNTTIEMLWMNPSVVNMVG